MEFKPAYLSLVESGELAQRVKQAQDILSCCMLCPRECRVDRLSGQLGVCKVGLEAMVSSYGPHFGEEPVLVGLNGSGTIFFTGCNLKCVFCQNYDISHLMRGHRISTHHLADVMLELQDVGCHNINLVTPTHQMPQILDAVNIAAGRGLAVPLVYNCGGYESVQALQILDGVVDIYMPDVKYGGNEPGMLYSGVPDYWDRAKEALREMHRQVGDLQVQRVKHNGRSTDIAQRGLLVRHLVLPDNLAYTNEVVSFIASEISRDTYINIMDQYRPEYRACDFPELNRRIKRDEYLRALDEAKRVGLHRFAD